MMYHFSRHVAMALGQAPRESFNSRRLQFVQPGQRTNRSSATVTISFSSGGFHATSDVVPGEPRDIDLVPGLHGHHAFLQNKQFRAHLCGSSWVAQVRQDRQVMNDSGVQSCQSRAEDGVWTTAGAYPERLSRSVHSSIPLHAAAEETPLVR